MVGRHLYSISKASFFLCMLVGFIVCPGCERIPADAQQGADAVTLTLNIGTSVIDAAQTKAVDPNVLPYEGIRTLRVIITSADKSSITYNNLFPVDESAVPVSAVLRAQLTLKNVPVGPSNIYVIANEASIDKTYETASLDLSKKLEVIDEAYEFFPKTYDQISEKGLPMSGWISNVNIGVDNASFSISLERTAVKIHLTVENATKDDLILKWVKFGKFISDRFYMFREASVDIPEDTKYKEQRFPVNEDEEMNFKLASQKKTDWNPVYIYPNYAYKDQTGPRPYTLSLATSLKEYQPSLLSNNMNSLVRNTQLNITARITASATISIKYEYVPWTVKEISVPPFN